MTQGEYALCSVTMLKRRDDDLLDIAASQTLLHDGRVYGVEQADMPDDGPLAAVLRY